MLTLGARRVAGRVSESTKATLAKALDSEARAAEFEERAQFVEELAATLAEERARGSAEVFEARAQDAADEAKAYADQGLNAQGAGLRALGRVVAELTRDRDQLRERVERCESAIPGFAFGGAVARRRSAPLSRAAGEKIKLHFDATGTRLPEFKHIDVSADNPEDALALELPGGTAREIVASRIAERFSACLFAESILPRWRELLADDGVLVLECLDGETLLAHAREGEVTFASFRAALADAGGEVALTHWATPEEMKSVLDQVGFVNVEVMSRAGSAAREDFMFRVTARKG